MTIQSNIEPVDNGVNVEALLGARTALTEMPAAGQFTWRAECEMVSGTHSRSTMKGFFGLGEEQDRETRHEIVSDHPAQFAATDMGPTPVEIVLSALASCLSGGVATIAQHRGIQLRSVTARVEGDMDLAGVLGVDPEVRNGLSAIRVTFDIDADASREDIEALVAQSQKRSAVFDLVTNPAAVTVNVA